MAFVERRPDVVKHNNKVELMALHNLPSYITLRNTSENGAFFGALYEDTDQLVEIDCGRLSFVDPVGLCLLRHHLASLALTCESVRLINLPHDKAAYMERMGLFDGVPAIHCANRPAGNQRRELADRLVELRQVRTPFEIDHAAARIAEALVGASETPCTPDPNGMRASPAERLHAILQYIFSELLNNAAFHGRARGFGEAEIWIAAQFYRPSRIHVCIVDTGCGFLNSLRGHSALLRETHSAAIEAALRPRVSCNRDLIRGLDSGNQGIGLSASHALATRADGSVDIFSGDAWLSSSSSHRAEHTMLRPWQGVGISLQMNRDTLQELDIPSIINDIAPNREARNFNFE